MRHIHMLLFYIGLLALTSWAEIVLSIVILDANDNRTLKLGYYVGLCKLRYRSIFFSHQFANDKSPFYYVDVTNICYFYLWKIIKLIYVNAP